MWDQLDTWVFYTFNGSLAEGHSWQLFWAIANTRMFDTAGGIIILSLYAVFVFSGTRTQAIERIAIGVLMTAATLATIALAKFTLDHGRAGPSLTLEPSILLRDIITDFKFKDRSGSSFPGDHAIIMMMVTGFIWFYAGRLFGLLMLVFSICFILPRLVVGAHWLTDNLVGSAVASLLALGWLLATPLHLKIIHLLSPYIEKMAHALERPIIWISGGRTDAGRELLNSPRHALKGFCMGSADIIPGVSGGTMALILGIYERLLEAIRSFDRDWVLNVVRLRFAPALARNDLLFLLPLLVGILAAIVFFTRIVPLPALIISHPEIIYGLFFGLILASIVILMGEVERYRLPEIITTLVGIALGLTIVNLVPVETPTALWFIFLCGFVAISAMLLPGISGSFILLILGKYAYIINALGEFNLPVIMAFCLGALSGVIVFTRTIVWMLHHYHQRTLLVIKGILIGSLWMIWPFQERVYETVREKQRLISATPVWPESLTSNIFWSLSLMLLGFVIVMLIHRLSRRKHPV